MKRSWCYPVTARPAVVGAEGDGPTPSSYHDSVEQPEHLQIPQAGCVKSQIRVLFL